MAVLMTAVLIWGNGEMVDTLFLLGEVRRDSLLD